METQITRKWMWRFVSIPQPAARVFRTISTGFPSWLRSQVFDTTPHNNKYWHKLAMEGETKFAFTTHDEAEVQFCFTNTLDQGMSPDGVLSAYHDKYRYDALTGFQVGPDMKRHINLHIDTGAEAEDFSEEIKEKKLKPVEAEIRRLEALVNEVTNEMEHLKEREMALRDVNGM